MERNPIMYEMRQTSKTFIESVKKEASKYGVNPRYFMVLKYLAKNNEKENSQADLCAFLKQKPSSISVTIQMMEKEGLVIRSKSLIDSRKYILKLTELGNEEYQIIKNAYATIENEITSMFTTHQIDEIYNLFDKIKKVLGDK